MKPQVIKVCRWCGKEFKTNVYGRKFCSDECKKQSDRERHKKASLRYYYECRDFINEKRRVKNSKIHIKKCAYCNREFKTNSLRQKYCCKICKNKAYYENKGKYRCNINLAKYYNIETKYKAIKYRTKWLKSEINKVRKLREEGKSYKQIALELGRTLFAVRYICEKYKIEKNKPIKNTYLKEKLKYMGVKNEI